MPYREIVQKRICLEHDGGGGDRGWTRFIRKSENCFHIAYCRYIPIHLILDNNSSSNGSLIFVSQPPPPPPHPLSRDHGLLTLTYKRSQFRWKLIETIILFGQWVVLKVWKPIVICLLYPDKILLLATGDWLISLA